MNRRARSPLALLALGGLMIAACEPGPSAQPSRSASTPASASGLASPAESIRPSTAAELPDGAIMQVVADGLRLRAEAGVDAAPVATLERGALVRVESEPAEVGGFTWRQVVSVANERGWAADGDATDAWLAPIDTSSDAAVIFSFSYGCDVVGPFNPPVVTVLDDGRVVGIDHIHGSVWWIRRLSDAGMSTVREDIMGSPYLQTSAEFLPRPKPGVDPPGHGACSFTFAMPNVGGDPIVVTSMGWAGEPEESTFYEPAPERRALDHLARNLMIIGDSLGDESWQAAPAIPYVADAYRVWVGADPSAGPRAGPPIDSAALGLGDVRSFGEPAGSGRCGTISREQAFEIARVLNAAGATDPVALDLLTYSAAQIDGISSTIVLAPTTPDGQPGCDAFSY